MKKIFSALTFSFLFISFCGAQVSEAKKFISVGEAAKAIVVLENELANNNRNQEVLLMLGDLYSYKNEWDKALKFYKKLVDVEPENPEYNFKYGGALGFKALDVIRIKAIIYIPDVKKHLEKAASLDKKHVKSRRALVELYTQLPSILGGSEEKAWKYARELNNISVTDALLAQAFLYKEAGKKQQAAVLYQKALKGLKFTSSRDRNYLNYEAGMVAAEHNLELTKGLRALDSYITNYSYLDIHPLEWAYYRKAQIYTHLNNKKEAQINIEKALTLRGNFKEALEQKERILKL